MTWPAGITLIVDLALACWPVAAHDRLAGWARDAGIGPIAKSGSPAFSMIKARRSMQRCSDLAGFRGRSRSGMDRRHRNRGRT
jgi:hypothetical protein